MESKYGLKIRNIQAGSLYGYNLGVRENYEYKRAMFTNNLLLYYLKDNGLKIEKNGFTKDIIGINFDYGTRSYEEELNHINKLIQNKDNKYTEEKINHFKNILSEVELNKNRFNKKTKEEIREIFYVNGVDVIYKTKKKDKEIEEKIHYKMLYRSTGKAKQGSCMFISERLYKKTYDFISMGIKLPKENSPIVEMSAYISLIASSIVDTVKINPNNILILKDVESFFETNVVSVETDENKNCIAKHIEKYKLKNTLFDGQCLVDDSIFPKWGNGAILLRHHMCKMGGLHTYIQKFFKDYFGDNYENAILYDMWGNKYYAKDIQIITTDNAMKWIKFDISYEYWCKKVNENGNLFGIVKTPHKSKLGEVQKMSYQMINSLDIDIMENVTKRSVDYINLLKKDNNEFLKYLEDNSNFSNDYEVLVALCKQNYDFTRSTYFRDRKNYIIESYIKKLKFGKVIQEADNFVIIGSPYAMLLHSVGEDVNKDSTFNIEEDCIQCFTNRFDDGEFLAEFRSPFNSKNNMGYLHNVHNEIFTKYFNFGNQVIAVNLIKTDFQDRNNGSDQDFDGIYATNQIDMVDYSKYCYKNFPTIVNNIPKEKNSYDNTLLNYAKIDNNLASAQLAIGESSNLAQLCLTYTYNFKKQKYIDYVCILSVLAQVAIDNAKRKFDINLDREIKRIKKDMNIDENKYPLFWLYIKKNFSIDKINYKLKCPMNFLCELQFKKIPSNSSTLKMEYFFKKFEVDKNRRKSKKVEDFIQKFSIDLYNYNVSEENNEDYNYLLLKSNYEEMIEEIRRIYISKTYLGLMSWLINRAFCIGAGIKSKKEISYSTIETNKSILLKVLYDINKKNFLEIFSNNS